MYQVEAVRTLVKPGSRARTGVRVSRNVVLLGATSLLTDISSEMVATVLPLYVVFALGASPLQFGVLDGLYNGASALVRVAAGFVADRGQKYKAVAAAGYGLSTICRVGLLLVSSFSGLLALTILLDRIGKGIRTAPRDALITLSTPREALGSAFGVHRAMDTVGAMIGPLAAFGILALAPGAFDAVFAVSLCVAVMGLGVIVLLVEDRKAAPAETAAKEVPSIKDAAKLLQGAAFRRVLIAGTLLSGATMSDAFVYLALQRRMAFDEALVPLLFVGTAVAFTALAIPLGRLSDRIGRVPVFLGGYIALIGVYAILLGGTIGVPQLLLVLGLFGVYYAATDGVLPALASTLLPERLIGSGLSLVVTGTSLGKLVASIAFGALWATAGLATAVTCFGIGLVLAGVISAALVVRVEQHA
jgi:MFS family permease